MLLARCWNACANEADFWRVSVGRVGCFVAAVWKIKIPNDLKLRSGNFLLRIKYLGDAARIYLGQRLLTDNFYNGNVFEVGINRFAPEILNQDLFLKILPLRKDAPIYLAEEAKPDFAGQDIICKLLTVDLVEIFTVQL